MMQRAKIQLYKWLRRSEQYAGTDMVYLFRGSLWLYIGQVVTMGAAFITSIAFANLLSAEMYGIYKYVLSFVGILAISTLSGLGGVITQSVAKGNEGTIYPAIWTRIRWGLIGCAASVIVAAYYFIRGNELLGWAFVAAAPFIPLMESLTLFQSYLQGKKLIGSFSVLLALNHVIATIVIIVTLYFSPHVAIILIAYYASWTILRTLAFYGILKKYPPNTNIDHDAISYGKHTSFIDAISSVVGSLDQLLIFHYIGAVELAIYTFALAPISQISGLFRNIPILAIPKLAGRSIASIQSRLLVRVGMLFFIGTVVSLLFIGFAPLLYQTLFPKYLSSVPFARALSLTLIFSFPQSIFASVLGAKLSETPKKLLYLWNLPSIASTTYILLTIRDHGIASVVGGRLLSTVLIFAISWIIWGVIKSNEQKEVRSM